MKLKIKVKDIEVEYKCFGESIDECEVLAKLSKALWDIQKNKKNSKEGKNK